MCKHNRDNSSLNTWTSVHRETLTARHACMQSDEDSTREHPVACMGCMVAKGCVGAHHCEGGAPMECVNDCVATPLHPPLHTMCATEHGSYWWACRHARSPPATTQSTSTSTQRWRVCACLGMKIDWLRRAPSVVCADVLVACSAEAHHACRYASECVAACGALGAEHVTHSMQT